MPDDVRKSKLSASQKLKVCALIATGYNSERITNILEEEDGVTVTLQNIYRNYVTNPRWKKIIVRLKREADRQILQHPLALKVNRLNIIRDAINEAFTWRLDKINYDKKGNELSRVEKRNIGMIANLIAEARKEVEGDKPLIDQSKHITQIFLSERLKEARTRTNDARLVDGS